MHALCAQKTCSIFLIKAALSFTKAIAAQTSGGRDLSVKMHMFCIRETHVRFAHGLYKHIVHRIRIPRSQNMQFAHRT